MAEKIYTIGSRTNAQENNQPCKDKRGNGSG